MRGCRESGHVGADDREDCLCRAFADARNLHQHLGKFLLVWREIVIDDGIYLINLLVQVYDVLEAYAYHLPLDRSKNAIQVISYLLW